MFELKRGDTFGFNIKLSSDDGAPLELQLGDIRRQLRTMSDALIVELAVAHMGIDGGYYLSAPSTEDWPITESGSPALIMDIEFTIDGRIRSSETMKIRVRKDVTRDE